MMVCNKISLVFGADWTATTHGCRRRSASNTNLANNGIRRVLANHVWGVNHVELLCSVLACKSQNGKFTTRVVREEIGDIQHLAVQDNPTRCLAVVFCHLLHGDPTVAAATATSNCTTAATATDLPNDGVWSILSNHIWRVNHVELLSCILACKSQNGKFS